MLIPKDAYLGLPDVGHKTKTHQIEHPISLKIVLSCVICLPSYVILDDWVIMGIIIIIYMKTPFFLWSTQFTIVVGSLNFGSFIGIKVKLVTFRVT